MVHCHSPVRFRGHLVTWAGIGQTTRVARRRQAAAWHESATHRGGLDLTPGLGEIGEQAAEHVAPAGDVLLPKQRSNLPERLPAAMCQRDPGAPDARQEI